MKEEEKKKKKKESKLAFKLWKERKDEELRQTKQKKLEEKSLKNQNQNQNIQHLIIIQVLPSGLIPMLGLLKKYKDL